MTQVECFFVGAAMALNLLGLGAAVMMPAIDLWGKRFFQAYFAVLVLYGCFGMVDEMIYRRPDMALPMEIVSYYETLLSSILLPMMMAYLHHCCRENWKRSPLFHTEMFLWTLYFIFLNVSLFTTLFYYITPDNKLCRGPLYPLMLLTIVAMQLLNLAGAVRWRKKLSKRHYYAFFFGFVPMVIAVIIHFFVSVFYLFAIGISACALSMFLLILSDQIELSMRQQREIAHQRSSIMVLQMRPHFIYNTMMSIYYLCKQNPDLAQQVTLDFTTYLRKNFTAIASNELIPFSDELEHIRAYLAVEKAQFEDSLFVDYDTTHIDFYLPPLTMQPIVENAVKHGMDPDSEPLHILIQTRRTDTGHEIIVENSGAGFVPADDSEPHIALNNIQQRLALMCRGEMMIMPRKEGGTIVKVIIPPVTPGTVLL